MPGTIAPTRKDDADRLISAMETRGSATAAALVAKASTSPWCQPSSRVTPLTINGPHSAPRPKMAHCSEAA